MEPLELPERAIAFCIGSVDGAVVVRRVERLRGGLDAITHLVELELRDGRTTEVVVRRFQGELGSRGISIEREVATLDALHDLDSSFEVPHVVAHDAHADRCDAPAILLTRVPGTIELSPNLASTLVPQLARALATLHALPVPCPSGLERFTVITERREKPVPPDIVAPDWSRAWRALERLSPDGEALIHHDFHIGNALFAEGRLTGIVDWTSARRGPTAFDVGYCRSDLSMAFGLAEADLFLSEYEAASRKAVPQIALWDLAGAVRACPDPNIWLPGWLDVGRSDLGAELIRDRLTTFVERALTRV